MKNFATILFAIFLLVATNFTNADTMELVAIADATVDSNGALGQELIEGAEVIETSMSGGSNISDGLYEFDLSGIPAGATINSAVLRMRTAFLVSNVGDEAPIEFFGFTGNGALELADQANSATVIGIDSFAVGTAADTDLDFEITNLIPLNNVLSDGNSDDFFTIRSETENFVTYRFHSLESTDSNASPATLIVTFSGGLLLGDVNMDCSVDLLDVNSFVEAVSTGTFIAEADINQDGNVNLLDVAPFVALLAGN